MDLSDYSCDCCDDILGDEVSHHDGLSLCSSCAATYTTRMALNLDFGEAVTEEEQMTERRSVSHNRGRFHYIPTPEEIEATKLMIRKTWSDEEELRRRVGPQFKQIPCIMIGFDNSADPVEWSRGNLLQTREAVREAYAKGLKNGHDPGLGEMGAKAKEVKKRRGTERPTEGE